MRPEGWVAVGPPWHGDMGEQDVWDDAVVSLARAECEGACRMHKGKVQVGVGDWSGFGEDGERPVKEAKSWERTRPPRTEWVQHEEGSVHRQLSPGGHTS